MTVVISPHFDDAVLSATATLLRPDDPATIITVCGGVPDHTEPSNWDRFCGFDEARAAAQIRAAEDRTACERLGVSAVHFDCLDAAYGTSDLSPLRTVLLELPPDTPVLAPAGIGGHPDHVRARDVVLTVDRPGPLYLYADLPYVAELWHWRTPAFASFGDPAALAALCGLPTPPARAILEVLVLNAAQWARKRHALWAYASQLGPLSVTARGLTSWPGPLQTEALWRIR